MQCCTKNPKAVPKKSEIPGAASACSFHKTKVSSLAKVLTTLH